MGQGTIPDWCLDDYKELELCKLYHCTPSQLDEEDHHRMMRHLAIQGGVDSYLTYERKSAQRMANLRAKRGR